MTQEDFNTVRDIYIKEIVDTYHNTLKSALDDAPQVFGWSDRLDEVFQEYIEGNKRLQERIMKYSLCDQTERMKLTNVIIRMFIMSKILAKTNA